MGKIKLTPFVFTEINPKIESNKKFTKNVDVNKFLTGFPLNKYWAFDFIKTIGECDITYVNKKYLNGKV